MTDIKPVAWTSKKGLRHLARTGFLSVGKNEDRERNMPIYGPEAADEITRLRQLLSEAEKRGREARAKALEEAAQVAEGKARDFNFQQALADYDDLAVGENGVRIEIADNIRALQSEER